ncbi:molybdenum cofactor guanylyltransferase protein A [Arcobacter venerupis]|uniref:Molybdenum cofactor guanylyltransferase protein A n=1 Tax=Arcobacter venerupis TaxID=1054033 RepID=A0AAE7B8N3_9BACT|nr:NTP transferase domain-containing protein [Arcobacter venerupis]QKF65837.1 molybdenum cofactor guanylyltransferase protein A [Arcobacter venerupis]RWS50341.1 molybdenum cofactor guanylyltransferase [Arcobacter venerupis]
MITPFEITCVILSGGKSSRMEEDKSLLPFASKTLIQYQYERLKPYFKDVYISSKVDKFDFLDKKYLIIDENKEVFSPILALDTIFKIFQNQKIFIITVDSPFVSIETISKLIYESKDCDICIAQTEKTHNLCGIFSSNISISIKTMISNHIHKVFYLIKNNKFKIIQFHNNGEFTNINNKNDYKEALNNIILPYNR